MRAGRFALAGVALLLLGVAAPARAAWEDWVALPKATAPDDLLLAVDALSPMQFFVGGISLKPTNDAFPIPEMLPVAYRTQDGGQTLQSVKGNLGASGGGLLSGMGSMVADLAFLDLTTGWAAVGGDVWRTQNAGGKWEKAALVDSKEGSVADLVRLDANTGVAVGTGGRAWRTRDGGATWDDAETGTGADLACAFFLDGRRGWAAGVKKRVEEVEEGGGMPREETYHDETVVLGTTDGGSSWKVLSTIPKDEEADGAGGKVPCPLQIVGDGDDGFLVLSRYDEAKGRAKEARLWRTRDGGKTWTDLQADFRVGTLKMFGEIPIHLSYVAAMHWRDGLAGHLVGATDTGLSAGSGGGGGDQPIYRTIDLSTADGGKTWVKTELGEITMSLGGGTMPSGDPRPTKGLFLDRFNGLLAGEKGNVWRYRMRCNKQSVCAPDGACEKREGDDAYYCYPAGATGPDGTGGEDGAGGSEGTAGKDAAGGEGVSPTLDVPPCEGDDCPKDGKGGGCAGGPLSGGPGAWPAALLLGFLLVATRRGRP